jgi:hypothetical protein
VSPTGQIVMSESDPYVRLRLRGSALRGPVTLGVTARSGAARINEDFVAPLPRVQLDPRRPTGEALVSLVGDNLKENVEDFSIELSVIDGDAELAADSVVVVLTDDD